MISHLANFYFAKWITGKILHEDFEILKTEKFLGGGCKLRFWFDPAKTFRGEADAQMPKDGRWLPW